MADIEGRISYAGLTSDTGDAQLTLSMGLDPFVCVMTLEPNSPPVPAVGTLEISGTFGTYRFTQCAVRSKSSTGGDSPRIRLEILDRRWKWQVGMGVFVGTYNLRTKQTAGTIYGTGPADPAENIRHPRDIARDLLDHLGEKGADVSAIPDMQERDYPFFQWDHVHPRVALAQLLDAVGCSLAPTVDDRFRVVRLGSGQGLPDGPIAEESSGLSGLRPDGIVCLADPTVFEALFECEPVARDVDGKWKSLSDVSYAPSGGFAKMDPEFRDLERTYKYVTTGETDRKRELARVIGCAQQSVWRSYRVKRLADGAAGLGSYLPNFATANAVWLTNLLGREKDPVSGQFQDRQPYCEGVFVSPESLTLVETNPGTRYSGAISLDATAGVITASDQLVRVGSNGQTNPGQVYVRLAFRYQYLQTKIPGRYYQILTLPGPSRGTGQAVIKRPDLEFRVYATYAPDGSGRYRQTGLSTNADQIGAAADYYLRAEATRYQRQTSLTRTYVGLHPFAPTGYVQQVSLQTNDGIPSTVASEGTEHDIAVPPYRIRRVNEGIDDNYRGGERGRAAPSRPADNAPTTKAIG